MITSNTHNNNNNDNGNYSGKNRNSFQTKIKFYITRPIEIPI